MRRSRLLVGNQNLGFDWDTRPRWSTSSGLLCFLRGISVIVASPRMAGVADFRLMISDGHWNELPHHFFNRQSAIGNDRRLEWIPIPNDTSTPVRKSLSENRLTKRLVGGNFKANKRRI
jgi:hypothetical protein